MPSDEESKAEDNNIRWKTRLELASKEKDKGNEAFKAKDFVAAAKQYEKAYKLILSIEAQLAIDDPLTVQKRNLLIAVLNNLAVSLFRLEFYRDAIECCNGVLKVEPENEKALFRRGQCWKELKEFDNALDDFKETLRLYPENQDARKAASSITGGKETALAQLMGNFNGMLLKPSAGSKSGKSDKDDAKTRAMIALAQEKIARENARSGPLRPAPFVGLRNEGATCYLNAVVQVLFHMPAVRSLVHSFDTSRVPLRGKLGVIQALQALFCRIENPRGEVTTGRSTSAVDLLGSFGWDAQDTTTQHDVGEMMSVLLEPLEDCLRDAKAPNHVARLFHVPLSYIDEVDRAATAAEREWIRERPGLSFPVNVDFLRDCGGLLEALDRMKARVDLIEGFNTSFDYEEWQRLLQVAMGNNDRDRVEECLKKIKEFEKNQDTGVGTKVVRRTTLMRRAPPILTFRLQRVQFDFDTMSDYKIHSRFEFPTELDMAPFVTPAAPRPSPATPETLSAAARESLAAAAGRGRPEMEEESRYRLYAVVTHIGGSYGGHYVSYIRPSGEQWYKFDDERVSFVDRGEAVDANFGGGTSMLSPLSFRSAYMLIYLRLDEGGDGCYGILPCPVPDHIRRMLEAKQEWQAVLPTSFTIALPFGKGAKGVRGRVVEVRVEAGQLGKLPDLLRTLRAQLAGRGAPLQPPAQRRFYGGDAPPEDLPAFDPELCLTLVSGHHITCIFDPKVELNRVLSRAAKGLLRAEWIDRRPGTLALRVAHAELEKDHGPLPAAGSGMPFEPHGDPFLLPLLHGDTVLRAVKRLQVLTGQVWDPADPGFHYLLFSAPTGRAEWRQLVLDGDLRVSALDTSVHILLVVHKRAADGPTEEDFRAAQEARDAERSRICLRSCAEKRKSKKSG